MTLLIIADHDNHKLAKATLHVLGAAQKIGGEVHVLVGGAACELVAKEAASVVGVAKVLLADDAAYKESLAENIAPLVASLAKNYTHILTAATSAGKDFMPRVAALMDVAQISEIIAVVALDTFKRPIYAGNAIETVQAKDAIKVITVRQTGFDAVSAIGGSAAIEKLASKGDSGLSQLVSRQESKSERPELTSARISWRARAGLKRKLCAGG